MKSKFDLNAAKAWANSKNNMPKNIASSTTTERHNSEWGHTSSTEFSLKGYRCNSDIFSIRASGPSVKQGKIKFSEGLNALNGIYELIKLSAKQSLKCNGINNAIRNYTDCIYMNAPETGSFIYKAEIDLDSDPSLGLNSDEKKEEAKFKRHLNLSFAKLLQLLSQSNLQEQLTYKKLLLLGIDEKLCDSLLCLFSDSADKIEFNFKWSVYEGLEPNLPSYIAFDDSFRNEIKRCKKILTTSTPKTLTSVPTYIERSSWVKGCEHGKIYFKLSIENKDINGSVDITDECKFESLKQKVKETIISDVTLLMSKKAGKSVEIIDICFELDKHQQIELHL
ncbi:hypothetical protein UA38_21200 [Photobacterium kishitanii]|uniref:Uncharacterized protein n=1 Tax=Photobacterium kishitanii TaxID=318456 RepID=A0AAX0Z0E8_9GAMM|nr:hypothetical protein [Photobacterium kishitanii]KJG55184.1 hypothetical protein UA38_21200 [Photobacterium kishitanii]KJG57477.1 hypothetical protein UA42_21380 [Photobacterium kishitanii]KJG64653.1 hypothetical protein UA41_22660 [Photobacterium kishitanii]PSX20964.1 hypothetical protein C0W70_01645 [Photobacterium kishitanii]PSX28416.1 hypothetical protein C0W52_10745 [Photobacterium kishitanii]